MVPMPELRSSIRASFTLAAILCCFTACASSGESPAGTHELGAARSFFDGHPPIATQDLVNVVVEIPAGTNAKWEVDKTDGALRWEEQDGRPRVVEYLAYPANYGMVPSTLLPSATGGDGDPLDVLLLGHSVLRGTIVQARLIGVLKVKDGGERDDKLVAVSAGSVFEHIESITALDARFPGVTTILETWMTHYKGPGVIESGGFQGPAEANALLRAAIDAFAAANLVVEGALQR